MAVAVSLEEPCLVVGFGLQTLMNNLVSGLIISFEKPVQIGDIIDIGGHADDDRILTTPVPTVMVKQFGAGSIDLQLSLWVRNIRQWTAVRTDMMLAIDRSFRQNGIHIPLPQQELHLRSFSKDQSLTKNKLMETD